MDVLCLQNVQVVSVLMRREFILNSNTVLLHDGHMDCVRTVRSYHWAIITENIQMNTCIYCCKPDCFVFSGLFSVIMRDLANLSHDGPKWIVLDGDIDPMWIESLNTVMDDNKVGTCSNLKSHFAFFIQSFFVILAIYLVLFISPSSITNIYNIKIQHFIFPCVMTIFEYVVYTMNLLHTSVWFGG
jgi:hypothetical protein